MCVIRLLQAPSSEILGFGTSSTIGDVIEESSQVLRGTEVAKVYRRVSENTTVIAFRLRGLARGRWYDQSLNIPFSSAFG